MHLIGQSDRMSMNIKKDFVFLNKSLLSSVNNPFIHFLHCLLCRLRGGWLVPAGRVTITGLTYRVHRQYIKTEDTTATHKNCSSVYFSDQLGLNYWIL